LRTSPRHFNGNFAPGSARQRNGTTSWKKFNENSPVPYHFSRFDLGRRSKSQWDLSRSSSRNIGRIKTIGSTIMYFLLRSARLNSSSQVDPQNSLSREIGVAQTTQCLWRGIETFSACLRYLDMRATLAAVEPLINPASCCQGEQSYS
jgi:hypothetical protein